MFALLTAAIAPGMALLSYFYLRNDYETTTASHVLRTFIIGIILVFPVMVLQYAFTTEGLLQTNVLQAFVLYGFFEEFFKWFMLFFFVYQYGKMTKRYDGIVYGASLSLGFASMENIFYLLAYGLEAAVTRALLPVSSHALYGVIMGYYIGRAKLEDDKRKVLLTLALIIPVLLHGIYDFILLSFGVYVLIGLVPFMVGLWLLALNKVKWANKLDH
ncbi:glutamic-type intramembrane protease PrsW [Bacillus sp. FJAT-45037]|uniref:glutamic-type intramembrane protease PrsW n=1 Tax=Bacillus sp. FJAT-45037 TaxID=2011007 RepID=UPI000C23FCE5|nr:glutamic-type intramembrane protease PrsW [Bacillus sp. FJAT-45037]